MNEIILYGMENKNKLPVGTSKLFGNPDVPDCFLWPHYVENGEEYDLSFVCQINCAEMSSYDTTGILPKTGMLYFFYDMDEMPSEASEEKAVRIFYYDIDMEGLHKMLRTEHDGNDMSMREIWLTAQASGKKVGLLLPSNANKTAEKWVPLLQIHSFETDAISIKFSEKNDLLFCISKAVQDYTDANVCHIEGNEVSGC